MIVRVFLPIKLKDSPPLDCHPTVKRGGTKSPEFNKGSLRILKRQERALDRWKGSGANRGQDLTSHDKGPRTSKSSSPSEEPDCRILRGYCGVKEFGHSGPFYTKPKAHAKEEEMPEDERRKPKLPSCIAEDNPVLDQLGLWRGRATCHQRHARVASQEKGQVLWVSHGSLVEEQFREKLSLPH